MDERAKAVVGIDDEGARLDVFVSACPGIVSRSMAQHLIDEGKVLVGGRLYRKNHRLDLGDEVVYELPPTPRPTVAPEKLPLDIVYEDNAVIVINKEAGRVVHPAAGNYSGTLVNAILAHTGLANIGAPLRPGIVHRLDKDTSGLLVAAKTDNAYMALVKQLKDRLIKREYLTLVGGGFADERGIIDAPIRRNPKDRKLMSVGAGGKEAVTRFEVLTTNGQYSLLKVALDTGRTHQIRVHMKYINHPVVGDPIYGSESINKKVGLGRQWLHAHGLQFISPLTGETLRFSSRPPIDLTAVLDKLGFERGQFGSPT